MAKGKDPSKVDRVKVWKESHKYSDGTAVTDYVKEKLVS